MRDSRMPWTWARDRVASARRAEGMARRSRSSRGAVVWLTPRRTRARGVLAAAHGVGNLWTAEKELEAQTARMTTKTKEER